MKRSTVVHLLFCLALAWSACNSSGERNNTDSSTTEVAVSTPQTPFQDISVADFQKRMGSEDVVILDVRTPPEVQEGMIEGAISIDFMDPNFKESIAELDKDKTYLVYCQSGGRSARACEVMSEMGFGSLYNLKEGFMGWPK